MAARQVTVRGEGVDLAQEILGLAAAFGFADEAVAEDVLFGNDRKVRGGKARIQRPDHEVERTPAFGNFTEILGVVALYPLILKQVLKPFACAFGP